MQQTTLSRDTIQKNYTYNTPTHVDNEIDLMNESNSQSALSMQNYEHYHVIRRNGAVAAFQPNKIELAVTKAFLAVNGSQSGVSSRVREQVKEITQAVITALLRSRPSGGTMHIEDIQDQVELSLMRQGEPAVARAFVLYREKHAAERAAKAKSKEKNSKLKANTPQLNVLDNGVLRPLDTNHLHHLLFNVCADFGEHVNPDAILTQTLRDIYDGIPLAEVYKASILAARSLIETDPDYIRVTARLLMHTIRQEVLGEEVSHQAMTDLYPEYFIKYITQGIDAHLLNPELATFNLLKLGKALNPNRDLQFTYLGLQTLYDRYFLHIKKRRIELPQAFFMRVAMGLALKESHREERAIEFYHLLSSFDFMSSTPTLFNSGSLRSQLSSCYLTTVSDDLEGIFESLKDNALLAKFAGGLGNDWTAVRAMGSWIKGTNGQSQGVVPFLKVVNDTAVAVNQGGKRKGAVCCYLESWHLDIEEFLELRKNTGDERRRTHDMNTANWIPDLFMKRVIEGGQWTLLSPNDCPDLHETYGKAFEVAYLNYEKACDEGRLTVFKRIPAIQLWRKMLGMLFETGHPWITFKDPCNIRSPQQHIGVVHSSNLCTEITLNTSKDEIAVCNLGSINLVQHLKKDETGRVLGLDTDKLYATIKTAMRMLDNVIDINFYPVEKARNSNLRHRPVGLGIMGFQDCLHAMRVPYSSNEAVAFADTSMELVCYNAYWVSSDLAAERGRYDSYEGSLWSRNILPQDTLDLLLKERDGYVEVDRSSTLDWNALRTKIAKNGMRNSNCIAIAPTATISNITGVSACIEPAYQNLYVKSNLSGEFTDVNEFMVRDLKRLDLWDDVMVADLKYFKGSLAKIDRVPIELRTLYSTAYEIDSRWIIEAAARRQKWIDQAQSLNLYFAQANGKKLDEAYKLAWLRGLKTTYYLRTLGATDAEMSTGRGGELNAVSNNVNKGQVMAVNTHASFVSKVVIAETNPAVCMIRPGDDIESCESCQ